MQDLLNAGQILGRSEMKKIMAGSGEWPGVKCCKDGTCTSCLSWSLGCNYYNGCDSGWECEEVSNC